MSRKLSIITKDGEKMIQDNISIYATYEGYPWDTKCLLHMFAYSRCPVTGKGCNEEDCPLPQSKPEDVKP
jgi:hypothetical protein